MPMPSRSSATPWSALFLALCGLLWCGYVAFPTANHLPCSTSGCALFREARFGGISLWWIGGAYFFTLTIVCLRGSREFSRLLAQIALLLDAVLLLVMFLTAPCFDCLVVAAILGLTFIVLRPKAAPGNTKFPTTIRRSILLPIWFGLFLGNCVLAAEEQFPPYVLGNAETSDVRLYFSPSCPFCRQAIELLGDKAALYPVEEQDGDFDAIIRMETLIASGVPIVQALDAAMDPESVDVPFMLFGRMRVASQLMRNKAQVWRQGFRALPLILINGMPHMDISQGGSGLSVRPLPETRSGDSIPKKEPDLDNGTSATDILPDFLQSSDVLGQCGGESGQPCE